PATRSAAGTPGRGEGAVGPGRAVGATGRGEGSLPPGGRGLPATGRGGESTRLLLPGPPCRAPPAAGPGSGPPARSPAPPCSLLRCGLLPDDLLGHAEGAARGRDAAVHGRLEQDLLDLVGGQAVAQGRAGVGGQLLQVTAGDQGGQRDAAAGAPVQA